MLKSMRPIDKLEALRLQNAMDLLRRQHSHNELFTELMVGMVMVSMHDLCLLYGSAAHQGPVHPVGIYFSIMTGGP